VANNRRTDSHQRCHALWRNSFVVAPTPPPKKMRTSSGVIVCSNPGSQVLSYLAAATARGCSVNTLANSAIPLNSGIDGLGRQQT
jgi:hypothetical protein